MLFVIFKPGNLEEGSGVGMIKRLKSNNIEGFISDCDSFEVSFPEDSSPEERLLIIGNTLMIDYRFFEVSPADDNNEY